MPPMRDRPGNNNSSFGKSSFVDDGINIRETYAEAERSSRRAPPQSTRPEMRGPSDISDILSGLKTKTINIQESTSTSNLNESSTISISDLKDMQGDGILPKKSKRRQRSDKNTVSLDI